MRMLMNNLHPDVAENPHDLVVYGGIGRAARAWADFDAIVVSLKVLEDDETLLVQGGRGQECRPYLPQGWSVGEWCAKQESDPKAVEKAARASMRVQVQAMVDFWNAGVPTLDYGNNIRQVALEEGLENAFAFPGFVPAYIRPLFCKGIGPFRWCALSGDPEDIYKTDAKVKELIDGPHLHNWTDRARERIAFQGLPARICWVGLGVRHKLGLAFNEMVRSGELNAPVVIGRDHLDSGSVASPNRETEAMKDGSDAVSDWPLLNALLNCASGATWVSLHHGGGVGMGFSQHSGMVICCDGSEDADRRIANVLWNDPATGVMRHADAGYDIALARARPRFEPTRDIEMTIDKTEHDDTINVERFVDAQNQIWPQPLNEVLNGKKRSHWAWFVLPQVRGLGQSRFAILYSIKDLDEAKAYLAHPVLGPRLIEINEAMMGLEAVTAERVLGGIDALKLQSCATLFEAAGGDDVFARVLGKYFLNQRCPETLGYLKEPAVMEDPSETA